jgi:hypothetical protein
MGDNYSPDNKLNNDNRYGIEEKPITNYKLTSDNLYNKLSNDNKLISDIIADPKATT